MRPVLLGASVLFATSLGGAALAQDGGEATEGYAIIEALDPPRGETAEAYRDVAARYSARTDPAYVTVLDGSLASGQQQQPRQNAPAARRDMPSLNLDGAGVFLIVILVIGGLFLWLKFGGAGTLLRREPAEMGPQQAPTGWNMGDADASRDPRSLIERIAAMADRSEAMVLLLRHCLLTGAQQTETRFARSDTERRAFRRLPRSWRFHEGLGELLRKAELAHYGGRPVSDEDFDGSIALGRLILGQRRAGGQGV